jgi:uncharacterized repeat protein (TIGR01451 family)
MGDHAVTATPRRAGLRNFFRLAFRPHRGSAKARRVLPLLGVAVMAAAFVATTGAPAAPVGASPLPAAGASPVTVTVTSSPTSVVTGQAFAYTITAANTGTAAATGLSMTDTLSELGIPQTKTAPFFTTSAGSCTYASSTATCTDATLPAGQVWTVTITGVELAAAGAVVPDTATVTGTESGSSFSGSGSNSTTIGPGLPAGFTQTTLASGLSRPVAMAFVPGGDIWIGEEGGTIVDYHNGAVQPTPVLTLPNVFLPQGSEDGLLGIAFDPNYATNHFVYISYTVAVTQNNVTTGYARVSRFTASGNTINPATEKVFYQGDEAQALHHPGNDLQIGPDGKLWWSVGDNDPNIWNGETLNNIYGKIIRFNLDGSIPPDDPFVNVPRAAKGIYAWGLRNPFRFTFLPNGHAMTADTGSSFWEELDTISAGGNYGWPWFEGNCFSCGTINPAYAYGHYTVDGAISAIAAYSGSTFPKAYDNVVFFVDYNRRTIDAVTFAPGSNYTTEVSDNVFDTNAGTIADLVEGPDGNLYFLSVFEGTFNKISAPGPFPPTAKATATPDAGPTPLTVNFSSAGSSDAFGKALTYSWKFGDGGTSTAANPTHKYTKSGTYTATLTVSSGTQTGKATTTVVVGQTPPTASITAPATYNAGNTVKFSGSATDPVDGTLPAYRYTWQVDFMNNGVAVPAYNAGIPGPFYGPVAGTTSGSFQIPTDPSQVPGSFYRVTLTVTDSRGLKTVVTKDIKPNTTSWTVNDPTAGTGYFVDGAWHTGTYTTTDVVGVHHVLTGMALGQVNGTTGYRFSGWADGSALTDSFTSAAAPATYTAKYEAATATLPTAWKSTDIGSPTTPGSTSYAAGSKSFYLDGAGTDEFQTQDQAHFVYQSMPGDGTIIARVRYQTNSSDWAKAGLMIRQSTTVGAPWVNLLVTPDVSPNTPDINGNGCDANGCLSPLPPVIPAVGNGVHMQVNTGSEAVGAPLTGFTDPNKWLKLTRQGDTFTSYESTDGKTWTAIGTKTVSMTGPVDIGLFDNAHDNPQGTLLTTTAFDHVKVTKVPVPGPLPAPWQDTDVGSPAIAGSAGYTAKTGTFTVNGAGADIFGTSDQFNYVYQPLAGDGNGTIIARVTSQTNTSSNAKAGVIIKQSTTAGSNYILIAVNPGGTVKVQYDFNGSTTATSIYNFPNVWMKLVSLNGAFTAYLSGDGTNWTPILSKTLPITFPATVGLFECSHNTGQLGTATFDNVSFTPGP